MTLLAGEQAAERLLSLPPDDGLELLCRAHLGWWTQARMGLSMGDLHWEWCRLRMTAQRLAVIAPRDHSKTETFTVNGTAWESIYTPGLWTYIFANSGDQAKAFLQRIITAVEKAEPWMVRGAIQRNQTTVTFANYATVTVAGAGKAVRSAHPDVIIGDDVLEEKTTATQQQRRGVSRWWFGTVANMAHPGTTRTIGSGDTMKQITFPPTRIMLVGTPFHQNDLLMGMKENPVYRFRRYKAEFFPEELVDGLAVEVS